MDKPISSTKEAGVFDASWNSTMRQIEVAELAQKNLHIFYIEIEDHGPEECVFQGLTKEEARGKFLAWLVTEPHVRERTNVLQ